MKNNKLNKSNGLVSKILKYAKFYFKNLLKLVTFNYTIFLLIFLAIIMISLSTYNVSSINVNQNIENSLQNISLFKELLTVVGVIFIILISTVVPHFKVQTLIAAIYTYFISMKLYRVFTLSYSNNNLSLMIVGTIIILFGLAIICSICFKVNKIFALKLSKKKREKVDDEFDKIYRKIFLLGLTIVLIGVILYSI